MLGYGLLGDVEVGGYLYYRARFMPDQPKHRLSARLRQCPKHSLPVGHLLILPPPPGLPQALPCES